MNAQRSNVARLFTLIDGSKPETEVLLPWAALFAKTWNVPVTLLHLIDPAHVDAPIEFATAAAGDYLALVASGPSWVGLSVETEVRVGLAHEEWRAIAQEQPDASLMILGAQRSGVTPAFLSGTLEDVIRALASPIVVIPQNVGAPAEIERVVVGTDRSSLSEAVLRMAAELAPTGGVGVMEMETLEQGSRPDHELLKATPTLTAEKIVIRGKAGPSILAAARHRDAQLVVIGSHGKSGILGVGSTAEWLARHSDRPVVIISERWVALRSVL